VGKPSRSDV
jgi:serine/threonine protein kinase